jgi:hypothetical protein
MRRTRVRSIRAPRRKREGIMQHWSRKEHAGRRQRKKRQKDSLEVKARGADLLLQRGGVLQVTRAGAQWVPLAFPPRALATTAARNIWAALSFVPLIDLIFAVASRSSSLLKALTCNTNSSRSWSNYLIVCCGFLNRRQIMTAQRGIQILTSLQHMHTANKPNV